MSTTTRTTTASAATLAVATLVLAACGTAESASGLSRGQQADADRLTQQALTYVGDPWEKRFREQFWVGQHVHDSWNPCHIGENVPQARQGQGAACWSLLRSQTRK